MKYVKSKIEGQEIHRLGAHIRSLPSGLESLLSYWLQKCAGRPMPARDDLPVQELRPWLGHLALIELAGDGKFRVRLCGTNLIRRFGREATGVLVDDLAVDVAQQLKAILRSVDRAAAPVIAVSHVQLGRTAVSHSEVALPLSGAGGRIGTVMLGSYPIRET
ncbi:MAG TPA: PAS domain-containing protein [Rhizomicrobium sp.]|nr:PAS domain-containing protein [Rhizomicrobium sp.]